jgi:O-antigen ligase
MEPVRNLLHRLRSLKIERSLGYYVEIALVILRFQALPVLAVAVVVLGAVSGFLATKLSLEITVLAIGGLIVVLSTLSRPEFVILLMLVTSSSIYSQNQIPTINVGFAFTAIELCLIFSLGLVVAQALGNKAKPYTKTPLDSPIALFFFASFVSMLNSALNLGTDVDQMEYRWRILFSYLVFFAVTNLVRTRQQLLTLVTGMLVIATIVAVLMIVQQAVGSSVEILPGRVQTAGVGEEDFAGVSRIRVPGESLILVMFMPAFILLITRGRLGDRGGWPLIAVTVALFVALAFTFNRRMWAGAAISIMTVFFLSTRDQRKNLLIFLCVLVVVSVLVIPLLNVFFPQLGVIFNALYLRGISLFSGDEVKYSASWQWRVMENAYARDVIREHPLFGIGPGNDYRPRIRLNDALTAHVHNGYYFVLVDLGIAGLIPLVWFSAMFLARGYRLWSTIQDQTLMAIALGLCLSYVTVLITCVAAPAFMEWYWTPVLGVMFGVNEVIYKLDSEAKA